MTLLILDDYRIAHKPTRT